MSKKIAPVADLAFGRTVRRPDNGLPCLKAQRGGYIPEGRRARIVLDRRDTDGQVIAQLQLAGGFRRLLHARMRLNRFQELYPAARLELTED